MHTILKIFNFNKATNLVLINSRGFCIHSCRLRFTIQWTCSVEKKKKTRIHQNIKTKIKLDGQKSIAGRLGMYPNQNMFVAKAHGSICISYFKMPLLSCSLFVTWLIKQVRGASPFLHFKIYIRQEVQLCQCPYNNCPANQMHNSVTKWVNQTLGWAKNPECGANHRSEPQERPKQPSGIRRKANTKPVGDLIYFFGGRYKREYTERGNLEFPGMNVDWNRGSSGAEATGEPWESRENEREKGTMESVHRRDCGTMEKFVRTSEEPWEEDNGTGKAWEPSWSWGLEHKENDCRRAQGGRKRNK